MRRTATIVMAVAGVALVLVSYFLLAAPWGAKSVANSNPRLPFAPLLLVLGIMIAFLSAVVYELMPEREDDTD